MQLSRVWADGEAPEQCEWLWNNLLTESIGHKHAGWVIRDGMDKYETKNAITPMRVLIIQKLFEGGVALITKASISYTK